MPVMGMVKMSIDQVVDVIAVRNRLVAAAKAVNMSRFVLAAVMSRRTVIGIALADRNRMLRHHTALFLVTEVSVVRVINVSIVLDLDMPAIGTVLVSVFRG
jgi:hypothetical protein